MMNKEQIIRAWKDEDYRASLSEEERSAMPGHPAGAVELSDADLHAAGGTAEAIPVTPITLSIMYSCVPLACANSVWSGTCEIPGISAGCCGEHVL